MQADNKDRLSDGNSSNRHSTQTLVTAVAVLILAGGAYLLTPGGTDAPPPEPEIAAPPVVAPAAISPPRPTPALAIAEAPDIPEPTEDPQQAEPAPPTPEETDAQLREAIEVVGLQLAPAIGAGYSAPWLIDRGIAASDQLARGLVPLRTLSIARPDGDFSVTKEGQRRFLNEDSYRRYDALVAAVTTLPVDTLVKLFHDFRPQLEEAYASLGYPAAAMDNTLIAALDGVLGASSIEDGPIELVSKGALYAYADPTLESASDLQKQLLRMGPENTEKLQRWAADLRSRLLE
ncbi:MAG: hypothetical protein ACI87W_000870 [Halieaceae bacterium]|jgi:hypothetical protein